MIRCCGASLNDVIEIIVYDTFTIGTAVKSESDINWQ